MGGLNASQENNEMIAKQIRTLENRLDKARRIVPWVFQHICNNGATTPTVKSIFRIRILLGWVEQTASQ